METQYGDISKYLYKIKCQNGDFGIGIFLRILDSKNQELVIIFITNKNINIMNKEVGIICNKGEIKFKIKNDFVKNELKIIEIEPSQENLNIFEFINIDYYFLKNKEFKDKQVYLFDLHYDNRKKYNVGIIQNINDETNKIEFLSFQKGKTSGGFIICYENNKVQLLGIYESQDNKKYWKDGTFIYEYIKG